MQAIFKNILFTYLFLAALGRHCRMQTFSSCGAPASLCVVFLVVEHRL